MAFQIQEALMRYQTKFPNESATVQRMLDLSRRPQAYSRTEFPAHFTASAWIVHSDERQILLTLHRKLGRWLQLGGHADGDGDLISAALREANEESGLTQLEIEDHNIFDLDIHPIPARGDEPAHEHFDVRFLIRHLQNEPLQISYESKDLRWFSANEVKSLNPDPSILKMMQKWLARSP